MRSLTHLHGGFVSAADDGNPFHNAFEDKYRLSETQTVTYPNEQPQATLWYHDHAVAITRLREAVDRIVDLCHELASAG